ncbi:MAG: NERD domain-containing protein [Desulfobacterales bacterium]|nr:NERD domain-containing protein [Desulfobacterales bacterium]
MIMLIPILLMLISLLTAFIIITAIKKYHRFKKHRSPFIDNFLRGPGQSLIDELAEINMDIFGYAAGLMVIPIFLYAGFISNLYIGNRPLSLSSARSFIIIGVIFTGYISFKLVQLLNRRRKIRLGYEGEVAVGQELNQMMRYGYYVYHDFVADQFNIDHIVLGPAGVFAVETKARTKPTSDNRKADATVIYDGKCLQFSNWKDVKTLDQAERQAKWLGQWLSSATGEQTQVKPVVALPGWYINRTSKNGIPVVNPKVFESYFKSIKEKRLDESRIIRIAHQIDQRCRNIIPHTADGFGRSESSKNRVPRRHPV